MKQRKHKPNPDPFSFVERAWRDLRNRSPKRLQRLRHSLAVIRLGQQRSFAACIKSRISTPRLSVNVLSAAAVVLGAVPTDLPDQEQALIHLANYKRMIGQTP